jgi:uncharacterized cupin superfamily protein
VTANLFDPEFEPQAEREGFRYRRARLGRQAGSERLGASLYELPPGQSAWPFHWHTANEELLIVLDGELKLRTPDGWRELERGEVVAFRVGPSGGHQLLNAGEASARVLLISEMNAPELAVYPDSGKLAVFDRAPGAPKSDDEISLSLRETDAVDYWEGEEPPSPEPS